VLESSELASVENRGFSKSKGRKQSRVYVKFPPDGHQQSEWAAEKNQFWVFGVDFKLVALSAF
jgi:hypothetical protein